MPSSVGFVIQGPHRPNIYHQIRQCLEFGPVVVSCYKEDPIPKLPKDVVLVLTDNTTPSKLSSSLPRQIKTTLKGLLLLDTELAIKIRCDEYYDNLKPMVEMVRMNPECYTTNNIFFLKSDPSTPFAAFHTSDHVIGGNRHMLINGMELGQRLLEGTYKDWTDIPAQPFGLTYTNTVSIESFLFLSWLEANGIDYSEAKSNVLAANKVMKKYCRCVEIDAMAHFEWRVGGELHKDSHYLFNNPYNKSIRNVSEL